MLVAGGTANGLSLSEEKLQHVARDTQLFVPLDLLIPLWEMHPKEITPAPSPLLQKRHLQNYSKQRNEKPIHL